MKNKIMIILPFLLLCSAWTGNYNLEVSNDSFQEKIILEFEDGEIEEIKNKYSNVEDGDFIVFNIVNDEIYSISSEKVKRVYDKQIEDSEIILNEKYSFDEIKIAKYINSCFKNTKYKEKNNYYHIKLSGDFTCGGLGIDELKLESTTNKIEVLDSTYKKVNNKYVWKINEENNDINFIVYKRNRFLEKIIFIGIFLLSALIIYVLFKRKSEKVNKI